MSHDDPSWRKYHVLKGDVKIKISQAKEKYLSDTAARLNNSNGNKKDWWRAASLVFGKQRDISDFDLVENDELIADAKLKANLFNSYFTSITKIDGEDDPMPDLPINTESELSSIVFPVDNVLKALSGVNKDSATGEDQVSNRALFNTRHSIAPTLTCIFNECMSQGKMPLFWKTSIVVPIFKQGSRDQVKNYRPISLLLMLYCSLRRSSASLLMIA